MAGCGTLGTASVKGGEAKIFEPPKCVVLGQTSYDQNWIDGNIEAGIAGFGWPRPAPRSECVQQAKPVARPAVKPKPTFRQRVKARVKAIVRREPEPVPIPTPAPVVTGPPPPVAPVEVKPIDPFDELIYAPAPPAAAVKPKRKSWWQR